MIILISVFFFSHYMFASSTAHATAMMPVMLAVGATIPGMPMPAYSLLLCLTLGIMGVISPYGTAPNLIYCGSGYLPSRDFWRLGGDFRPDLLRRPPRRRRSLDAHDVRMSAGPVALLRSVR